MIEKSFPQDAHEVGGKDSMRMPSTTQESRTSLPKQTRTIAVQELRYSRRLVPDELRHGDFTMSPGELLEFGRREYLQTEGIDRKSFVEACARDFTVDTSLAERMLRNELLSRVEPDGTLIFIVYEETR
jgi:hypothetical protein